MKSRHRVEDYFAGVLRGRDRQKFEGHLAQCKSCRGALEQLARLDARLSRELPGTITQAEPRREWIQHIKANLPRTKAAPMTTRRVAFAGIAASLVMTLVIVLLLVQPWGGKTESQEFLAKAYDMTLAKTFNGTFVVLDGDVPVIEGDFSFSPEDRWRTQLKTASGLTIEEIQIGGRAWRRGGSGTWVSLTKEEPLFNLPRGLGAFEGFDGLLGSVSTLSDVRQTGTNSYAGSDRLYTARLRSKGDDGNLEFGFSRIRDYPPIMEVSISQAGLINDIRLSFEPAAGESVEMQFLLSDYGSPVQIEAPVK